MRSALSVVLFAALTVLAVAPAAADPTADIAAMGQAFASVHSFHADITTPKGTSMSMDVILPNKTHMTMNGRMQVIRIDDDMWMNMGGSWQHMSMGGAMMQRPLAMARGAGIDGKPANNYTITDEGPDSIGGVPTHKYHLVNKTDGGVVDMWLSKGLPIQIQVMGKDGVSTIKYSEYNSVPDITPPV